MTEDTAFRVAGFVMIIVGLVISLLGGYALIYGTRGGQ